MTDAQTLLVDDATVSPPLWLFAELTHRCSLHRVFCYNPVDFARRRDEPSTAQWIDVLRQVRQLGAAQLDSSGGEPLLRDDLKELVAEGWQLGFYINLITSDIGLIKARPARLKAVGLDHIQLSFQDSTCEVNDFPSNTRAFDLKSRAVLLTKQYDYPMVLNVILHRHNLDHVECITEMAVAVGIEYLELANTQHYGWGLINRVQLMSTWEQLQRAEAVVNAYRGKLGSRLRILFVVPDYLEPHPKACVSSWGAAFLAATPDGTALPYHAAQTAPGLRLPNAADMLLAEIWNQSEAFNHFRGDVWMQESYHSCPEKHKDLGGCRCQALTLTGDAAQADPACDKSPHHSRVQEVVLYARYTQQSAVTGEYSLILRSDVSSLRLSSAPK